MYIHVLRRCTCTKHVPRWYMCTHVSNNENTFPTRKKNKKIRLHVVRSTPVEDVHYVLYTCTHVCIYIYMYCTYYMYVVHVYHMYNKLEYIHVIHYLIL